MTLKVYYDLMSQPSRALILFLKYNKIPYIDCPVALVKGDHLSEEYGNINPFHKVPVIDDDGFKLTESATILKYLAVKHKVPEHWYNPNDLKKWAKVDEYMNWQHLNLRTFGTMYFLAKMGLKQPYDERALENWRVQLEVGLTQIERLFLAKSPFLNGFDEITLADLLCSCELEQPITAGYDLLGARPVLRAYMERVRAKLAPFYEEVHHENRLLQQKLQLKEAGVKRV